MLRFVRRSELASQNKRFDEQAHWSALFILVAALFFVAASVSGSIAQNAPQPVEFHAEPLVIETATGTVSFQVEVAETSVEQATGLMFRKSMAEKAGMLFDFDRTRMVSMWMRNTYLPLDMLFIRLDGTIATIAENTEPLSEEIVSSGEPVRYVLEINAFLASELGISVGDVVQHRVIAENLESEE